MEKAKLQAYQQQTKEAVIDAFMKLKEKYPNQYWEQLEAFTLRGKLLRGSLILFTEEMYAKKNSEQGKKLAAAAELIQSGFLIHDDIMDNDNIRRGKPSMHALFAQEKTQRYGESMAICLGDIAFFAAAALTEDTTATAIINDELIRVGFGQIEDITPKEAETVEEIVSRYTWKTASYTFLLPFRLGLHLTQRNDQLPVLTKLANHLGILFQIWDDELGIYGTTTLGKTIGIDVLRERQTVHLTLIKQHATAEEKAKIKHMATQETLTQEQVKVLQGYADIYAKERVQKLLQEHKKQALQTIEQLDIDEQHAKILTWLTEYIITRKK